MEKLTHEELRWTLNAVTEAVERCAEEEKTGESNLERSLAHLRKEQLQKIQNTLSNAFEHKDKRIYIT